MNRDPNPVKSTWIWKKFTFFSQFLGILELLEQLIKSVYLVDTFLENLNWHYWYTYIHIGLCFSKKISFNIERAPNVRYVNILYPVINFDRVENFTRVQKFLSADAKIRFTSKNSIKTCICSRISLTSGYFDSLQLGNSTKRTGNERWYRERGIICCQEERKRYCILLPDLPFQVQ